MSFRTVFLLLVLALFSSASQAATETELGAYGDLNETEWATATVSLQSTDFVAELVKGSSLSDIWDLPPGLLFCNRTTDTKFLHSDVETLVTRLYAGKSNAALLRKTTGEIWKIVHKTGKVWRGTQICESHLYDDICNFGEFDVPFSVAEYEIVNDILNDHCGDLGGWVFFIKWAIMLGRDATNDDGTFRWVCGNSPPPNGLPGPIPDGSDVKRRRET